MKYYLLAVICISLVTLSACAETSVLTFKSNAKLNKAMKNALKFLNGVEVKHGRKHRRVSLVKAKVNAKPDSIINRKVSNKVNFVEKPTQKKTNKVSKKKRCLKGRKNAKKLLLEGKTKMAAEALKFCKAKKLKKRKGKKSGKTAAAAPAKK